MRTYDYSLASTFSYVAQWQKRITWGFYCILAIYDVSRCYYLKIFKENVNALKVKIFYEEKMDSRTRPYKCNVLVIISSK